MILNFELRFYDYTTNSILISKQVVFQFKLQSFLILSRTPPQVFFLFEVTRHCRLFTWKLRNKVSLPPPRLNVADYGMRLEDIAQKAVEKGQISSQAKNDMLRSKLWSGLRDPLLKNASRYKYDTVEKFDQLLKEIRSIELDLSNYASGSDNKIQHQPAVVEQSGMQEMIKSMKLLNTRMESFEGELKKLKESKPDDHTSSSNSQFRGQGRGNYRGSDRRGRFNNNRGWRGRGYTGNQQNQNYNSQTRGLNG